MLFIVSNKKFWDRWYLYRRISKVWILWLIIYTQEQYEVLPKSWWNSSAV